METKNSSRTLVIGAAAGIIIAGALGAAFLLGGQAGGSEEAAVAAATQASPTAQTQQEYADVPASGQDNSDTAPQTDDGSQPQGEGPQVDEPTATMTPVPEDEGDEESPTDTPTATPTATPWGPDDLAAEPTATSTPNPCLLCNDLDLAAPIDMAPEISNIDTSFCFPNLVMKFDLQYADVVWFTYVENGTTYHSQHIDADTFVGFLSEDVGFLGWSVLLIENIRIHATDIQGNHAISDEIPRPEMEFC